jgi:hypothetical protein
VLTEVKLTDGTWTLRWLCQHPQVPLLAEAFQEIGPCRFRVEQLRCDQSGVSFYGAWRGHKTPFCIQLPGWHEFVRAKGLPEFGLTGSAAKEFFRRFKAWQANQAILELKAERLTFPELAAIAPELTDHPSIEKMAAQAAFSGKRPSKRGAPKGRKPPPGVQELIAWVDFYRAKVALSLEAAVAATLEKHASLVPPRWLEPEDALTKAYKRSVSAVRTHRDEAKRRVKGQKSRN